MTDADREPTPLDHPPGPRPTANQTILDVEADLREDGVELDNPAVPASVFDGCETAGDYREVVAEETDREETRRHVVAVANRRIRWLDEHEGEVDDGA